MKIAVTGATGSLGGAVLKYLASEGHEVVGLGRNEAKLSQLSEDGFEMINCDILDINAIENSIIGVDILVHCAAYASPFGSRRKYFETNVQGTKNVFIAAKYRSVKRIIVISSASIFDGGRPDIKHPDDMPHKSMRPKHAYGASKYDSELYCLEQTDIPWIGLRPRAVFGKGDETLIPRLERLISDKRYLTIGKGDALIDITCLGNFLDAVVCAIEANDDALHRFYNISNGDARSFKSIIAAYANRNERQLKHRKIPLFPMLIYSNLITIAASLVPGKTWEPAITNYGLRQITRSLRLDISGAKKYLNWTPRLTFEDGLEELE